MVNGEWCRIAFNGEKKAGIRMNGEWKMEDTCLMCDAILSFPPLPFSYEFQLDLSYSFYDDASILPILNQHTHSYRYDCYGITANWLQEIYYCHIYAICCSPFTRQPNPCLGGTDASCKNMAKLKGEWKKPSDKIFKRSFKTLRLWIVQDKQEALAFFKAEYTVVSPRIFTCELKIDKYT